MAEEANYGQQLAGGGRHRAGGGGVSGAIEVVSTQLKSVFGCMGTASKTIEQNAKKTYEWYDKAAARMGKLTGGTNNMTSPRGMGFPMPNFGLAQGSKRSDLGG